jgi:hypothetical protein
MASNKSYYGIIAALLILLISFYYFCNKEKYIEFSKFTEKFDDIQVFNSNNMSEEETLKKNSSTTFIIVTTYPIISIANNFSNLFQNMGYKTKIIEELTDDDLVNNNNDDIYLILYNNRQDKKTPIKFIYYQIEQIENVDFNINNMNNANVIWEMSMKNYKKYNHIPLPKVYIMPLPFYYNENDNKIYDDTDCDVFFYGGQNSRRDAILIEIAKKKYNLKIAHSIFNEERDNYIKKSKIVINISYYKNTSIETARINEVLQFNKLVISEYSNNDYFNKTLYEKYVEFIDRIDDNLVAGSDKDL